MNRFIAKSLLAFILLLSTTVGAFGADQVTFRNNVKVYGKVVATNGIAGRELLVFDLAPNTGAAVDATTYKQVLFPGRACVVKNITIGCIVPPAGGTCTVKVLKGTSSGNTMLNAASADATALVANTGSVRTLSATAADLALTATQGIYAEYVGAQSTTDAQGVVALVEIEPTLP